MKKHSSASRWFIFFTVLVDIIGLGVIIPVIPELLANMLQVEENEASIYGGFLIFSFALMQFAFSPLLGMLSDKFGRRPVLLLSLLGLGIDYYIHAIAPTIFWLFISRIFAGITGASITVATAYMADVSTPQNKAQNFGLIGAAFGLGFFVGPLLGGYCSQWGVTVPFYVACALTLMNFVYGIIVLPESLAVEKRKEINWKRVNPFGSLKYLKSQEMIFGLIFAFFIVYVASHSLQSTWSYFTMHKFNWNPEMVGYSLAVVGITVVIVQAGLVKHVVNRFGETNTVIGGFFMWFFGMILFSIVWDQWLLMLSLVPYCLGGVASPTIQSVISNQVPENEQGALQGGLTSIISISSILGPLIMTGIFYGFTGGGAGFYFPGAPFVLSALLIAIAIWLVIVSLRKLNRNPDAVIRDR